MGNGKTTTKSESDQKEGESLRKTSRENGNVSAHKYKSNCHKYGKTHSINECPAYKKKCNIC